MRKKQDEEHEKLLKEVLEEPLEDLQETKKSIQKAIIYLGAFFIILLFATWMFTIGDTTPRAKPNNVPTLEEVTQELTINRPESSDINHYIIYDEHIKLIAAKIVTETCSLPDETCYTHALYYFVRDNIGYLNDPINEYYETPHETLLAAHADCDGQAILLASLLQAVGINTQFAYQPGHVYVQAWLPKKSLFSSEYTREWVNLDTTCKECRPGQLTGLYN